MGVETDCRRVASKRYGDVEIWRYGVLDLESGAAHLGTWRHRSIELQSSGDVL